MDLGIQAKGAIFNLLAGQLAVESLGQGTDLELGVFVGSQAAEADLATVVDESGELVVPLGGVGDEHRCNCVVASVVCSGIDGARAEIEQ